MDYSAIVNVYVRLIKMGRRTIEQVPMIIRAQVESALNK